jgi:hypothetical protein
MMPHNREALPLRRPCETFNMTFGGQNAEFLITIGFYPDGRIGEVFIDGPKAGSEIDNITRDAAVLISLGLQHRVSFSTMRNAVTRNLDGSASSIAGAVLDRIERHIAAGQSRTF